MFNKEQQDIAKQKVKKMQNINNNVNFKGAYIIKGSAKSVNKFESELKRILMTKRESNVHTMPLTELYNNSQPYTEILVCTDSHVNNLKTYLQKKVALQEKRIKKFVNDFHSWDKDKQKKWRVDLQKAVMLASENEQNMTYPGEIALQNGNPDSFLEWVTTAIKEGNKLYNKISGLGKFPFPAKIRRLDADKSFIALIDDNFNIKEGFIRGKSNKIDIESVANKEYRYKNNKFHEIITYKTAPLEENVIEKSEKFIYDKKGKLKKVIQRDTYGQITDIIRPKNEPIEHQLCSK